MEDWMLSITDGGSLARALNLPIDDRLKELLAERRTQLAEFEDLSEIARFVVVQPGDEVGALEGQLGFSVFRNPVDGRLFDDPEFTPGWEWAADHGHYFELVFIFDDSGFAHVVIVEKSPGVDSNLLKLCTDYASEHV
jgi:hypothetical protein